MPLLIVNPLQIRVAAIYKQDSLGHTFLSVLVLWWFKELTSLPEKMHCLIKRLEMDVVFLRASISCYNDAVSLRVSLWGETVS